jgi:hypothetical protein
MRSKVKIKKSGAYSKVYTKNVKGGKWTREVDKESKEREKGGRDIV